MPDRQPTVWVVGDAMADVAVTAPHFRRTPEDPLVPALPLPDPADPALALSPGGAANLAANLAAQGVHAVLLAPLPADADDPYARRLRGRLDALGVGVCAFPSPGLTVKTRFVEGGRLAGRADRDTQSPPVTPTDPSKLPYRLPSAVVLTDYSKGALDQAAVRAWVRWAHSRGVPVFADPKQWHQGKFDGSPVDFMCANWLEACGSRAGVPDIDPADDGWAKTLAASCRAAWGPFGAVVVKRGPHGSVWCRRKFAKPARPDTISGPVESNPVEAGIVPPVKPQAVYDVTGAGDTYLAGLVAAHLRGADLPDACLYASAAAGVAVGRPGTAVVSAADTVAALKPLVAQPRGVLSRDAAVALARRLTTLGCRVGLNNGCYRLLTRGHVASLRAAAGLCDFLLVAVDSDDRVRRLKGDSVVAEADRAAVVAGVAGVGASFVFAEDPGRMILAVRPAVMVKSEDYRGEGVAGSEYLHSWQGRLELVPLVGGEHNRDLIERIRKGGS